MEWTEKDFEELAERVSRQTLNCTSEEKGVAALANVFTKLAVKISVATVREYEAMKSERQKLD